jgi:hypothetical protein
MVEVVFQVSKSTLGKDRKIYFDLEKNGEHVASLVIQHPDLITEVGELSYLQELLEVNTIVLRKETK